MSNKLKFKDSHSEIVYFQNKIRETLLLKEEEIKSDDFLKKFDTQIKENINEFNNNVKSIGTMKGYKFTFTPNQSKKDLLQDVSLLLTTSIDNQDITIQFISNGDESIDITFNRTTINYTKNIQNYLNSLYDYYPKWKQYWSKKINEYNETTTQSI